MTKGLVSIITPAFNSEKFIEQTIISVINQTYNHWEMIIINDGSKDNTTTIVNKFELIDKRIKLLNQENKGCAAARNNGINNANGQYICLLDSDDLWEPRFLESQIALLNSKNAYLAFSSHKRIDSNNNEILKPYKVPEKVNYKDMLKSCYISCLTGIYDTQKYGKFYLNEDLHSLRDDYKYWLDILKKVDFAYGNQEILASYRILNNSTSRKKIKVIIPHFNILYKKEKIGFIKSLYYLINWMIISLKKYSK